jgi:flagellar hook-length control protein FliK
LGSALCVADKPHPTCLQERAPFQLIHEAEAAAQRLDEAAAAVAGDSAAAAAVEGYLPRDAPATQPRQQRQHTKGQHSAAANGSLVAAPVEGDEEGPTELLKLQPAVRPAAAGASSSAGNSSATGPLDGYLAVFRQQQELQMKSLGIRDDEEASGQPTPAADATAVTGSSSSSGGSSQQQQQQQQTPTALQRQDSSKRRVTFAPDVAYSCPAQPEQQASLEQPVLAFTLHGSDQAGFSSSSNSNSHGTLIGELQVTSAADADAAETEGASGAAQQHQEGQRQQQQQQQQQQASEAWKLFLPPALGGVGVPVKTAMQQPVANGSSRRSARSAAPAADGSSSSQVSAAGGAGGAADSNGAAQAAAPPNQARPSSSSNGSSSSGAEATKRRFTPNVRPRRSVVMLDEVPGVTVLQRGGPRAAAAAAAAPQPPPPQPAANAANGAAAPSVQQQATRANGSSSSSRQQQQVVHIGPLDAATSRWRQASSDRAAAANGGLHHPHDGSSSDGGASSIDDARSDASSDEQWCYDAGSQQQQNGSSSSRRQPAADCDVWSEDEQGADGDDADSTSDSEARDGTHRLPGAAAGAGDSSDGANDDEAVSVGAASRALKSTLPFFDKTGVTVSISEYGAMWNQLSTWVSPATVAYVGRPQGAAAAAHAAAAKQQPQEEEEEGGGRSAPPPPLVAVQQRTALINLLASAAPPVLEALQASVPQAQLAAQLSALVHTFAMAGPLPALQGRQWQLLVALLLGALSAWRLPALRPVFARQQQPDGGDLAALLVRLGSDVDRFWALLQLFELEA